MCVVAANSFVNKDVIDHCIMAGNPANQIGVVTFNDNGPQLIYKANNEK